MQNDEMFKNAVDCIELAVEDYNLLKEDKRRTSSSVRNLNTGLLLLLKCILKKKSPENSNHVLLYQRSKKIKDSTGQEIEVGIENKTVNFHEIKSRLDEFEYKFDWSNLDKINEIRNDLEHRFHDPSKGSAEQAFSKALPLIVKILDECLHCKPSNILSADCWEFLKNNEETFKINLAYCHATFDAIGDKYEDVNKILDYLECPECLSSFVRQTDADNCSFDKVELQCDECDKISEIDKIIEGVNYIQYYVSQTKGGEPEIFISKCDRCDKHSYSESLEKCISESCVEPKKCRTCGNEFNSNDDASTMDGECEDCINNIHFA